MLTRSLDKAKEAYLRRDIEASKQAHNQGSLGEGEPHKTGQGQYIKSLVYGGLDGIITTFAVVAGVAGASLSSGIVLILGFANVFADGLSMAIGDFLSTRAENEYNNAERVREEWEVENLPEGERREMLELYQEKGIPADEARTIVDILQRHKKAWVDIMMVEELGIVEESESPLKHAFATFISFLVFGCLPLAIYVVSIFASGVLRSAFPISIAVTAATLFTLGALKVRITDKNWFLSGLEMLIVGGIAAAAAYGIGELLSGLA